MDCTKCKNYEPKSKVPRRGKWAVGVAGGIALESEDGMYLGKVVCKNKTSEQLNELLESLK